MTWSRLTYLCFVHAAAPLLTPVVSPRSRIVPSWGIRPHWLACRYENGKVRVHG